MFNIVAGKLFDLFGRVPAPRSVVAHLRRNPAINAAERHRLENEAIDCRHDRESCAIGRREAAPDKIDARERRGLIRDLVRQTRFEGIQRQVQTEQREREARETARDISAEKPVNEQRSAADERSARMQERLAQQDRNRQARWATGMGVSFDH